MPNRLAREKSPYLRQHADNPVDWQPWGPGALAQAEAENKPLFLSIGYSSCHWCHVMAHESFEDPAVADVLNRDFVPVKVDREERPDVDRVYMTYVQQTSGHGGWPLNVWLTPRGLPFYGGTYFSPVDLPGRPGFVTVLTAIARQWREQPDRIITGAAEVIAALRRLAEGGGGPGPGDAGATLAEAAGAAFEAGFRHFHETYDPQWGGFGGAPKFPRAATLHFLFRVAARPGAGSPAGTAAAGMAAHTLQRMAEGGVHDHVGGGFHRYSVDARWHVPHFEKMLYDQAQIAWNFLEARQATGREVFGWIARGIFAYVRRDLTGPRGGFYSAEDADSAPETAGPPVHAKTPLVEGAFYGWTRSELERALAGTGGVADTPTLVDFFCAHFGVEPGGNVADDPRGEFQGRNILRQQQPLARTAQQFHWELPAAEAALAAGLEQLRVARGRRPRPALDDKVITAWNGLMISALAKGAQVLGEPEHLAAAARAAEFLHGGLYDAVSGTLFRSWREGRGEVAGFAEDYACLIQGLLDLYEAGFELRWLQWAEELQRAMDAQFWDAPNGGYFNSREDDPTLILRLKEDYDGAEPAPNSVAAINLTRLDWMLGGGSGAVPHVTYRERARRTLEALRPQWSRAPHALPQMLCALELALAEPRTVVLAGDPRTPEFQALASVVHERAGPRRVLLGADGGAGQAWLAARKPYLAEMKPLGGRATAYVCENFTCQRPETEPAGLRRLLG